MKNQKIILSDNYLDKNNFEFENEFATLFKDSIIIKQYNNKWQLNLINAKRAQVVDNRKLVPNIFLGFASVGFLIGALILKISFQQLMFCILFSIVCLVLSITIIVIEHRFLLINNNGDLINFKINNYQKCSAIKIAILINKKVKSNRLSTTL